MLTRPGSGSLDEAEVEAATWKLVADAAAGGRLLVDLTEVELSQATPLALLAPGRSPILPDPLPSELEETGWVESASSQGPDEDLVLHPHVGTPGPTFDASVLATAEAQARFHRNLAAVTAVLAGMRVSGVARAHGIAASTLSRLVRRTKGLGQIACVPNATCQGDRLVHPELQQLIRKLYTRPLRPTITATCEDVQLKHLAEELSQREGKPISVPSYHQVWDARAGDCSRDDSRWDCHHSACSRSRAHLCENSRDPGGGVVPGQSERRRLHAAGEDGD